MDITFFGAAQTVTGSKHLLVTPHNKRILLDCGMFQGLGRDTDPKNRHFGFDPSTLDAVILSHAHIDHSGCLPRLVAEGFLGPIYTTDATIDLCTVMLADSAHIQEADVRYLNKRRVREGKEELKPLYSEEEVKACLEHFKPVPLDSWIKIFDDVELYLTDAGHILGSVAINLKLWKDEKQSVSITYTGDIGRYEDRILKAPAPFPQADYIIAESTYGDRLHGAPDAAEETLESIIRHTCVDKKGKLIIPSFALGRTQELVYAMDKLFNEGKLPKVPVFVDSPLAVNATNIMRRHPSFFNSEIRTYMERDPDPFGFNNLRYIQKLEESKAINGIEGPCIIISASGMAEAGRIKHHLANGLEDERTTVLLVGYCTPESLGARLGRGDKTVRIFGEEVKVKAEVRIITSYSAHADYKEMMRYLGCQNIEKVKRLFLVHGEAETQKNYKLKLMEMGFDDVVIPMEGESFKLH
jgi:metallo-beta-lactamase family protein